MTIKRYSMRKLGALLSACLCLLGSLQAQDQFDLQRRSELSIGVETALPLNGWDLYQNASKSAGFGAGLSLKHIYNINSVMGTAMQVGYIYFFPNNLEGTKVSSNQFFLKAGLRFKISRVYFEPECGISSFSGNVPDLESGGFSRNGITPFTYAMAIGVLPGEKLDISLRYEAMTKDKTTGFLGLRLAYKIPLGGE